MPFAVLGATQVGLIAAITLIVVPLPAIQREFAISPSELALLSAAYGLAFGGLLLVGGRLADRLGANRMFISGMSIFGTSSVIGGFSAEYLMVLGARFTQGIGAALAAPAAIGLMMRLYPDQHRRNRALAVWGTLSVTGAVTGTVASGLITTVASWRWTFFVPALIAVVAAAGARHLPRIHPHATSRLGVVDGTLATTGLLMFSYGVLESAPALVAAGAVTLTGFLIRQARSADPLLPIAMIADRTRGVALLVIWLTAAASTTSTFLLSLYLQQIQGRSATTTSAAFLPLLLVIAMGPISARLAGRFGARHITVLGSLLAAASMALLSRINVDSPYSGVILAALIIFPIGAGLAFAGATVAALGGVAQERRGVAGGLVNTAMEIGPTVGLALLLALASNRTHGLLRSGHDAVQATTSGYAAAMAATALAFVVIALAVRFTFERKKQP
nr:MFS transporter [Phytoactinopolyspora mesophila]